MPLWLSNVLAFLNMTFPLGTYAGVAVRLHITFLFLFLILWLRFGDFFDTLQVEALFFLFVLLHEFGHVFGCRSVGGEADRILMWPLGGLAFCAAPRRPWPEFVTVACGPMVNLVLAVVLYFALVPWVGLAGAPSWNPMQMWAVGPRGGLAGLASDAFYVNYLLLLFNLALVFYPFDGGRLVQIALWWRVGYRRSMSIATVVGMVGAVLLVFYGIFSRNLLLAVMGVFGFVTCYQQRRALAHDMAMVDVYGNQIVGAQPWEGGAYDGEKRDSALARWRQAHADRKAARHRQRAQADQAEVDRILDKVHEQGIASLSEKEKRTLARATERQRRG